MVATMRPSRWRLVLTPAFVGAGLLISWAVFLSLTPQETDPEILNRAILQESFVRHVELVAASFAIATAVGVPLGIAMATAGRWLRVPVFLVANLGQAIPSIGVLVFASAVFGLGLRPALLALVVYALLPILRNTMVGVQGVDPAAVESARGVGMTRLQSLVFVELPLASTVIFAGLRTSLILIVGTATLAAFIGAGGLGVVINAGINQSDRIVFVGAVMVAALALIADWTLGVLERAIAPRM
jgi:osmoprotectant transport system permease protein